MEIDLTNIFNRLKKILLNFEDPLLPKLKEDGKYDLWSFKDLVIDGRKRKELYFAGLIIQGKHVGFYYMPIYTDTKLRNVFSPELIKLLKGKSCFHIRNLDKNLEKQIESALKKGYELYQKRGWI